MKKIKNFIVQALYKPSFAFILCLIFLLINLILDGTLFRIFHLNQDLRVVRNRIKHIEQKNSDIENKIKKSSDLDFVEKEAGKRLDYVGEGDLIFIFPENM